jgi:hypothetical protein
MQDDGSTKRTGNVSVLRQGLDVDYFHQLHSARRAGRHGDIRLGTPETGLFSFALPRNRFPENPGDSSLAIMQPLHRHDYGSFSGTIPSGRGAGTVELKNKGKAVIVESGPGRIRFALMNARHPQEYLLIQKQGKDWFLINVSGRGESDATTFGKDKYKVTDTPESYYRPGVTASPKIDGAAALLRLLKNRAEVVSIRPRSGGGPIKHTWRIGGLNKLQIPPSLQDTVLRAEIYGKKGNKAISAAELGGLLNTNTEASVAEQRRRGIRLMLALYNVASPEIKTRPEKRKIFDKVNTITGGVAHPLVEATDPESIKKLVDTVVSGKHPLTGEGVVFFEDDVVPVKYVPAPEHDVYIKRIFKAQTQDNSERAGGFGYSLTDTGDEVGEVGSGINRADAESMLNNPEEWLGRKTRIKSRLQHPSGAYVSPSLIARHEG